MFWKRGAAAFAASAMMVVSAAAYAQDVNHSALAAGHPAGVHKAQWVLVNGHWIWLVGGAFIVAGAGLAASGGSNAGAVVTTTCAPESTGCSSTPTTTTTTTTTTTSTTTTH